MKLQIGNTTVRIGEQMNKGILPFLFNLKEMSRKDSRSSCSTTRNSAKKRNHSKKRKRR